MPSFVSRELAWAWLIVVGGLIITPGGIECIVCGPLLSALLGFATVGVGIAGFVGSRRSA